MVRQWLRSIQRQVQGLPALAILIFMLTMTGALTYWAYQRTKAEDQMRLSRVEVRFKESVENRFRIYIDALLHTRSFIQTSKQVSIKEFQNYIQAMDLKQRYPGFLAIGRVLKFPKSQLTSIESQVRKQGYPEFNVWPEDPRDQYTAIVAIEPFDSINQRAFGFDMSTEKNRREAMLAARDSGKPALTEKIVLVQEEGAPTSQEPLYGFIVYVPVYQNGLPIETVEQRRAAHLGWIHGPFRVRELFNAVLNEQDFISDRVSLEIYDGPRVDKDEKIFQPADVQAETSEYFNNDIRPRVTTLNIADRTWTAVLIPRANFRSPSSKDTPWQIFILGTLVSVILYFFARFANRHSAAIAQSERQLRLITDTLPVFISYVDHSGRFRFANKLYSSWFGKSQEEIQGQPAEKVLGPEAEKFSRPIRGRALQGEKIDYYTEITHSEKGKRLLHAQYLPDIKSDGTVAGTVVLATDITELKSSEENLKEQSRILELINQTGLSLRGELELSKITQIVTDVATELTNARFGAFLYNATNEKGEIPLYALSGVPREAFERFPILRNTKIFGPTLSGKKIIRSDDITAHLDFGQSLPHNGLPRDHLPVKSYLAVPVVTGAGEVLGAIFLGHEKPNVFTEKSEQLVAGIAAQAAVAMDNSKLVAALKASEQKMKNLADQQAFLANAGEVLGSSLDVRQILTQLAQISVPQIADWCAVQMKTADGRIEHVAAAHKDPEKVKLAEEFAKKFPSDPNAQSGAGAVIRTGKPEHVAHLTPEMIRQSAPTEEHIRVIEELQLRSYLCLPLKARNEVYGAITLIFAESGRVYTESDLQFAEDLARRASVAVDNAKLYSEAQAINRVKDEFLATLSHELRTPLNVILGHSEILKSEMGKVDEEFRVSLDAIYRNAKAQNQIIGDLLDISAIITGKINFNPLMTSVEEIVNSAVESVRFAAESKGLVLKNQIRDNGISIYGDPVRLQQVVWNLLSNAVKFTPKGGIIEVETSVSNSQCMIKVKDNGKGIEPDFLPFVFDRFRQEDNSMTRKFGGLGLGLSIVRQLVEMHGGQIKVKSPGKDQGSVFTVCLPIRAVRPILGKETVETLEGTDQSLSESLNGLSVLIVDDEKDARQMVEKILTRAGAQVTGAQSSSEALQAYQKQKPDLIISDLGMPEEDGFHFVRKLRIYESQAGVFTPAIALSAYARDEDRARSLAAGFQGHLAKPVEVQKLVRALSDLAEQRI